MATVTFPLPFVLLALQHWLQLVWTVQESVERKEEREDERKEEREERRKKRREKRTERKEERRKNREERGEKRKEVESKIDIKWREISSAITINILWIFIKPKSYHLIAVVHVHVLYSLFLLKLHVTLNYTRV